jgi:hypothetical protein
MERRALQTLQSNPLDQADPSIYMLAEPAPRPRLGKWFVFAFFVGVVAALSIVAITNLIR